MPLRKANSANQPNHRYSADGSSIHGGKYCSVGENNGILGHCSDMTFLEGTRNPLVSTLRLHAIRPYVAGLVATALQAGGEPFRSVTSSGKDTA